MVGRGKQQCPPTPSNRTNSQMQAMPLPHQLNSIMPYHRNQKRNNRVPTSYMLNLERTQPSSHYQKITTTVPHLMEAAILSNRTNSQKQAMPLSHQLNIIKPYHSNQKRTNHVPTK